MAENAYRILITGQEAREVEISRSMPNPIRLGTNPSCAIPCRKELYGQDFEVLIQYENDRWQVKEKFGCKLCINPGGVRAQVSTVAHGTSLSVRSEDGKEFFILTFMKQQDSAGQDYSRRIYLPIESGSRIAIGGARGMHICLPDPAAAKEAVTLYMNHRIWTVRVERTQMKVLLNGTPITGEVQLPEGSFLMVANYSFFYKQGCLYTTSKEKMQITGLTSDIEKDQNSALEYPVFIRSTRVRPQLSTGLIEVLPPKQITKKPNEHVLLQVIPAVISLCLMIVIRGMMGNGGSFVLYSALTMVMTLIVGQITRNVQKKERIEEENNRQLVYQDYIRKKVDEIVQARQEESIIRHRIFRPIEENISIVRNFDRGLFDRAPQDNDFLGVRLGTGTVEAVKQIKANVREYKDTDDPLMDTPEELMEKYRYIENAPITSFVRQGNGIAVIGKRSNLYEMLKIIAMDIAIRHYYKEAHMFFIIGQNDVERFAWTKWLRHCCEEDSTLRSVVYDDESAKVHLERLYRMLTSRKDEAVDMKEDAAWPNYAIVFVYNSDFIRNHPVSQFFEESGRLGVIFIFFEEHEELIPRGCREVIRLDNDEKTGKLVLCENDDVQQMFSYEPIADDTVMEVARKTFPIHVVEASLEGEMTKNISLLELLGVPSVDQLNIEGRWAASRVYKSMGVPLGVKTKNDVVSLDLHEKFHGPHGLVAGTTGSGKSEILQSYILSMAIHFHPHEVGFLIIDFKGGGMANQFEKLPHLIGTITNIEGREVDRSLKSIKAELLRRQRIFAECDVNQIDKYIQLHKQNPEKAPIPLPHLIMIVDEFAELKAEYPDFMKELISAARIGRSLGVHLILATQKPSGVVDDQIWSNSKFKLCLKVQTHADSKEVLRTPLAAEIREPGRAYLQVGNNEIFELFQSAYSGAKVQMNNAGAQRTFKISELNPWGRADVIYTNKKSGEDEGNTSTELIEIVKHVHNYCERMHIEKLPQICMAPLPTEMMLQNVAAEEAPEYSLTAVLGIYDDPENQVQAPLTLDLSSSNTYIIGSAQMGKTTLLQTIIASLAARYPASYVNVYVVDGSSSMTKNMEKANIIGGIAYLDEEERIVNLLQMLNTEIKSRKTKFNSANVSSFRAYLEAGYKDLPHIVLIMDNIVAFKEYYPNLYDEYMLLTREGLSVGINVVISSSQFSAVSMRILTGFGNRLALNCNDSGEYSSLFDRCRMQPADTPGRGLFVREKRILEYQTALAADGNTEKQRNENLETLLLSYAALSGNVRARKIPVVPEKVYEDEFYAEYKPSRRYMVPMGISYNSVTPVEMDLLETGIMPIIGRGKIGKTNFLAHVLAYIQRTRMENRTTAYIIDSVEKAHDAAEDYNFVEHYTIDITELPDILSDIVAELEERQQYVIEHRKDGSESELLARFPLILLAVENAEFCHEASRSQETMKLIGRLQKLLRFKCCVLINNVENVSAIGAGEMIKRLRDGKQAIFFEDLANNKLLDNITIKTVNAYPKPIIPGDAYLYKNGGIVDKIRTVLHQ